MIARGPALIALGAAGFLLGAAAVRAAVPLPVDFGLRAKLAHLQAHGERYDAVILGTSASQFGIRPAVLDAELERLGYPQTSFNLAIAGLNAYELVAVADELLARRPARLSRVWLEVLPWQLPAGAERREALVARDVWWRSTPRTLEVLAALVRSELGAAEIRAQCGFHARRWLQHSVSFARAPEILSPWLEPAPAPPFLDEEALLAESGWKALAEDDPGQAAARQRFMQRVGAWKKEIARLDEANASDDFDIMLDMPALTALIARLEDADCRVLLYVPPVERSTACAYRLAQAGELPPLLGFNAPLRYPTLYRLDRRFDNSHLNAQGADDFSLALARAAVAGPLAEGSR